MEKPIALITGVGEGTGAALARRYVAGGYHVAMIARDKARLAALEDELGDATAFACDLSDLDALDAVIAEIKSRLGSPKVLVHNAVSASFGGFMELDPAHLERNFRVNTTSLLHLARALTPDMVEAGEGAVLVTGNTAALRGKPYTALFAPTKAAQRIFAEALARELGPKGVHVAYIVIDAVINVPWTRDTQAPDKPDAFFAEPEDIAEEVFHIGAQRRSVWSFDHVIRPFGEVW